MLLRCSGLGIGDSPPPGATHQNPGRTRSGQPSKSTKVDDNGNYTMKIFQAILTPEYAAELLHNNTINRPLKRHQVDFLAREIMNGNWKFNGDAIRISHDGRLLDGQHRLAAVVKAKKAIDTIMIVGLDPAIFHTIDCGVRRNAGDMLAIRGEKNSRNNAAALFLVGAILEKNGNLYAMHGWGKSSNSEILKLYDLYPDINQSFIKWGSISKGIVPLSVSTAMHYLFSRKHRDKADEFFSLLESGEGLESGNPILLLRKRLIENACAKSKISKRYMAALFVKAWNCWITNNKMYSLRFREVGDCPESFPTIL